MDIEKIEVDDEWEWYIGQLFYKLIDKKSNINCVVELAPGFKYKIAYALERMNFKGILYIIDANSNVIEYVVNKYKQILPNAKIVGICKDFSDAIEDLPEKIDLFLANHVIDDMLIENYITKANYNRMFDQKEEGDKYLKLWESFANDDVNSEKIIENIFDSFKDFFDKKEINNIVISQYRSNLFFLGKDENVEKLVRKCFNKINLLINSDKNIQTLLDFYPFGDDERYLGKELLNNTQNEKNWLVGRPKRNK